MQAFAANPTTFGFLLDSQAGRPYDLNHKQVLTVAFPSNLILPYITLARARGLQNRQMVSNGAPEGPVLSRELTSQRYTKIWFLRILIRLLARQRTPPPRGPSV
jgi:hypothetical protein